MRPLNRRDFLHASAGLAAAFGTGWSAVTADEPPPPNRGGANERLNIACIGVRGQGMNHVRGYAGRHNCAVTYICDVDTAAADRAVAAAEQGQRSRPRFVQDFRRALDDRNVHAVSIATPNHWHALAAIWAMQAGKDVYVEKPVSHNVSEGRRMVEAARRHNRICQTGTQIRSQAGVREAMTFLRDGRLGRLQVARGLCYKRRPSIGQVGAAGGTIPRTIDYSLWCGPAPLQQPLRRTRLHYDWHWVWDYGNGDLGNQGIHQMDVARWAIGSNELARAAISAGGRFGYTDDGQTANTQVCVFDYGNAELIFEVRGLPTPDYRGARVGNVLHCANGYLVVGVPGGSNYSSAIAYDRDGREIRRFQGGGDHFANFIRAVRSRRREDLHADILEGHLSSALCHLANISYRLGRPTPFDRARGVLGDDAEANETLTRTIEHLRTNMVDTSTVQLRAGRRLTIDPRAETCGDDREANQMLTRVYRRGFEVPARI